jgi:hypothetical protein
MQPNNTNETTTIEPTQPFNELMMGGMGFVDSQAAEEVASQSVPNPTTPTQTIAPSPQVDYNNPLIILMLRLHQHIYTKCGWNPTNGKAGFDLAAQVTSPVFIGDIPGISQLVPTHSSTNELGLLTKGTNTDQTINGYVSKSGQPSYRIQLGNGSERLIKPVWPNPQKTWGQQALAGAKRLMVLQGATMTSVVEQAPNNEEATFRQCNR